ncbi:hypothetical protein ABW19_dt0206368 [Dactylella cylindrospora]|nr:hypothetical protein ABW19_dt0206368 [Dactylella cylindrospora]
MDLIDFNRVLDELLIPDAFRKVLSPYSHDFPFIVKDVVRGIWFNGWAATRLSLSRFLAGGLPLAVSAAENTVRSLPVSLCFLSWRDAMQACLGRLTFEGPGHRQLRSESLDNRGLKDVTGPNLASSGASSIFLPFEKVSFFSLFLF